MDQEDQAPESWFVFPTKLLAALGVKAERVLSVRVCPHAANIAAATAASMYCMSPRSHGLRGWLTV